ncbi:hypothetical protein GW932_00820 [archaeon]|nr:hypothetical protein [archaeon]
MLKLLFILERESANEIIVSYGNDFKNTINRNISNKFSSYISEETFYQLLEDERIEKINSDDANITKSSGISQISFKKILLNYWYYFLSLILIGVFIFLLIKSKDKK